MQQVNKENCKGPSRGILFISPSFSRGGMERQLTFLLDRFASSCPLQLALFRGQVEYKVPDNVEVVDLKKKYKVDPFFMWRLFQLIRENKDKIIHARGDGANYYTIFFTLLLGVSSCFLEFRNSGQEYYRQYKVIGFLTRLLPVRRFRVVANSQTAVDELDRVAGVPATFIANGIDVDRFKRQNVDKDDCFHIGFVGRIVEQKNLILLVDAVSRVLDQDPGCKVKVTIIGNRSEPEYWPKLQEKILSVGLSSVFVFQDLVPDPENYYPHFNLFVLPSLFEGTPNVLLEAMACEVFCIASDKANSEKLLPEAFTFSCQSSQELAEVIVRFMVLPDSEKELICQNNRRVVIERYSVDKMVCDYAAEYDAVS